MRTRKTMVALAAAALAAACSTGVVIAGGTGPPDNSKEIERALDSDKPKNVILLIGDGTGDSELTIGRYYLNGVDGPPMAYETLPFTGEYHTWNLKYGPGPDYAPNYVPDSAPTATAWSTGKKTGDARLSQGMSAAEAVPGSNQGFRSTTGSTSTSAAAAPATSRRSTAARTPSSTTRGRRASST